MPRPTNFTRLERRFIGYVCALEGYPETAKYCPTRAARLAGYSPRRLNQTVYKLTHRPHVKAVLDAHREQSEREFEEIMQEAGIW